jgi:hypothetical protein
LLWAALGPDGCASSARRFFSATKYKTRGSFFQQKRKVHVHCPTFKDISIDVKVM